MDDGAQEAIIKAQREVAAPSQGAPIYLVVLRRDRLVGIDLPEILAAGAGVLPTFRYEALVTRLTGKTPR